MVLVMSSTSPPEVATGLELLLRDLLGDALTAADDAYAVDGLTPRFVATPASVERLAAVLAAAD